MMAKRPSFMSRAEYRDLRDQLGLTNDALAKLMRVNPRTVRRWQSGESSINARTAMVLRGMAKSKKVYRST